MCSPSHTGKVLGAPDPMDLLVQWRRTAPSVHVRTVPFFFPNVPMVITSHNEMDVKDSLVLPYAVANSKSLFG